MCWSAGGRGGRERWCHIWYVLDGDKQLKIHMYTTPVQSWCLGEKMDRCAKRLIPITHRYGGLHVSYDVLLLRVSQDRLDLCLGKQGTAAGPLTLHTMWLLVIVWEYAYRRGKQMASGVMWSNWFEWIKSNTLFEKEKDPLQITQIYYGYCGTNLGSDPCSELFKKTACNLGCLS